MASPKQKRSSDYFNYVFKKHSKEHQYAMDNTMLYDIRSLPDIELKKKEPSSQTIVENDTLAAAKCCNGAAVPPLILDMASDLKAGGGWRGNNVAQEESLCRCSNLGWYLENFVVEKNGIWSSPYPLGKYECIYVPSVCVFMKRDTGVAQTAFGHDVTFSLLPENEWYFVDVVVIAAVRHPQIPYSVSEKNLMSLKINAMFHLAVLYGKQSIVLGAFGCGVFKNPPLDVAKMFNEAFQKYKNSSLIVLYAILGDGNLSAFRKIIK